MSLDIQYTDYQQFERELKFELKDVLDSFELPNSQAIAAALHDRVMDLFDSKINIQAD